MKIVNSFLVLIQAVFYVVDRFWAQEHGAQKNLKKNFPG